MEARSSSLGPVLVVDDDPGQCVVLSRLLREMGYAVEVLHDGRACLDGLERLAPECVCLDLMMPGLSGLEILGEIGPRWPQLPVIVLTADASVESVVDAMRLGAYDYLVKPVDRTRFQTVIRNAVERRRLSRRLRELEQEVGQRRGRSRIVGASPAMRALFADLDRVAASDITVLVSGESGTGKELAARAIHDFSARAGRPYLALNCAAIPAELIESELFGHEKGAFTSAVERHLGVIERADGGTLFLDEIGELGAPLQAKLLRVLQERRFTRIGGVGELRSDFRLIAATNRNLLGEMQAGRFREDLYFRIAVFEVEIPPLRDRREDIPLLALHFIDELSAEAGRPAPALDPATEAILLGYAWPGNVRELRNTVERALVVCDGESIAPQHLPPRIRKPDDQPAGTEVTGTGDGSGRPEPPTGTATAGSLDLERLERSAITAAVERSGGNLSRAAKLLGISRTTLYRKLRRYATSDSNSGDPGRLAEG